MKIAFVSIITLVALACNAIASLGATATPAPTNTPVATATPAATNTPLPPPTETEIPATPTPAPVGAPVDGGNFEFTIRKVAKLERMSPGGVVFTPKAGYMIVDMEIYIKNKSESELTIPWNTVYILEDNGDKWMPWFGSYKETDTSLGIGVRVYDNDEFVFMSEAYVRAVYIVKDNRTVWFGVGNSPLVEATVK